MRRARQRRRSPLVGVVALVLAAAVAGTAAAGSGPEATGSASKTAKRALKKAKKANKKAKAARASADTAQSSANTANAKADAIKGRSATDDVCDPASGSFLDCVGVSLTLDRPGRVLVSSAANQVSEGAGRAEAFCRLEVDDATDPIPHDTRNDPGEDVTDNTASDAQNGFAHTAVTNVLAAGTHTFELSCGEDVGDAEIHDSLISAVALGSG